jgi:hypothetical protein
MAPGLLRLVASGKEAIVGVLYVVVIGVLVYLCTLLFRYLPRGFTLYHTAKN